MRRRSAALRAGPFDPGNLSRAVNVDGSGRGTMARARNRSCPPFSQAPNANGPSEKLRQPIQLGVQAMWLCVLASRPVCPTQSSCNTAQRSRASSTDRSVRKIGPVTGLSTTRSVTRRGGPDRGAGCQQTGQAPLRSAAERLDRLEITRRYLTNSHFIVFTCTGSVGLPDN